VQHVEVIVEPDEAQVVDARERVQVEVGQAQHERGQHRQREEHADHDQGGRDERPGGALAVHGILIIRPRLRRVR
jgi:hypothetical protein